MHVPSNFAGNEPARWCDALAEDAANIATDAGIAADDATVEFGGSGASLAPAVSLVLVGVDGAAAAGREGSADNAAAADAATRQTHMSAMVIDER